MPSKNKRINLTVDDRLYKRLQDYYDFRRKTQFWGVLTMSGLCLDIIRAYLREHSDDIYGDREE